MKQSKRHKGKISPNTKSVVIIAGSVVGLIALIIVAAMSSEPNKPLSIASVSPSASPSATIQGNNCTPQILTASQTKDTATTSLKYISTTKVPVTYSVAGDANNAGQTKTDEYFISKFTLTNTTATNIKLGDYAPSSTSNVGTSPYRDPTIISDGLIFGTYKYMMLKLDISGKGISGGIHNRPALVQSFEDDEINYSLKEVINLNPRQTVDLYYLVPNSSRVEIMPGMDSQGCPGTAWRVKG